ncbi:hypothetical protein MKW94_000826 [Papaver nudicaule]|uniref:Uncharacterized protein n=1 Tax=Papaver nudicaule TaxID=74823 RepID=A0AA41VQ87_PAPNU|nr:hypothetical protein [Papaver nudicaule]
MEQLWDEFEFARRASEDGTSAPSTAATQEDSEQQVETDSHTACSLGKDHHLILDEEIGIRCILCSYVKLDIKYILPAFATSCARGRLRRRMSAEDEEFPTFDSFMFHETGGNQVSNLHTTGTIWDNFRGIREILYPHQIEGVEFVWRNLAGGIELNVLNKNPSHDIGGCIISHDPGTGKTLLTIAFLRTFMKTFKDCRPVLIAPSNMLLTWEDEFKKWYGEDITFHNLSSVKFSGTEECAAQKLVQNESSDMKRLAKIASWRRGNSILAVSYQLFERYTAEELGEEIVSLKAKIRKNIRKSLLELPNVLILDEGHTPRNKNSKIFKSLKKVKTERRIILSGTLFQNNFDELYTTLSLARPKFADMILNKTDKTRGRPSLVTGEEARGNWVSLASSIGNSSDDQQLEMIKKLMAPFVHEYKGSILHKKLPGLRECVVVLHPFPLQKKLLENVRDGMNNAFEVDYATALVSVHPSLLTRCSVAKQSGNVNSSVTTLIDENQKIKEDVFRLDYHEGVKSKFLMQLIKLSEAMKEKVLVFSQYLDPPSLICDHLYSAWGWRMGEEILRMDGTLDMNKRQSLIKRFNDPSSKVKVLFASTKSSGEGICLTGASRVVLLDVVWNPAVYKQAISRAYRLGQKKVVYTYHLITSGTSEEDKYLVQTRKDHLSQLVFSMEQHGKTENQDKPCPKFSDDKILQAMMGNKEFKVIFDKIIPRESNLLETLGKDMMRNGTVV